MLKRLNTKYTDFIKEDLYIKSELHTIIRTMIKTDPIACVLDTLANSYQLYPDDNVINWLSIGDNLNMLTHIAKSNRDSGTGDIWSRRKVEMRIGRTIKRILSDVVKEKCKFNYVGKAIISTEKKLHSQSNDKVTSIIFSTKETGDEFSKKWQSYGFSLSYDNTDETSGGVFDLCSTALTLKVNGNVYKTKVFDYLDESYRSHWDDSGGYFIIQSIEKLPIGGESILTSRTNRIENGVDVKSITYDVEIELENKFGDKSIEEINDSDVEKFVNEFIAKVKMIRAPEDSKIEEVKGEEIRKWYLASSYQEVMGQLGSSCMSHPECQGYLDIYTENPEKISLLILKNKEDKLLGRSILWKLDSGKTFMDRVYCLTEYDERIFVNYAKEKGYYYRNNGGNNNMKFFFDGKEVDIRSELSVSVANSDFEYYPYIDTLKDFDEVNSVLHYENNAFRFDKEFRDTGGKWSGYDHDDD